MANYLVTGVAGFIASRLAELLLQQGHTVTGLDNLNDAYDVRMKFYRLDRLQKLLGFKFRRLDIGEKEAVEELDQDTQKERFDAVINLAARAGVRQSVENPWVYMQTNINGTLNLLELCRRREIPKFILASTSSVYGKDAPLPTPEHAASDQPLQAYAASKKAAEVLCHTYHYLYGLDVTVFRYFTVYGPAGRPDMVMFRFAQWITEGRPVVVNGDGSQSRGFTYLEDIAAGTILGLKPLGYEVINLGGHETIALTGLIEMIETLSRKKAEIIYRPFHKADMLANWADVQKARRLLGWQPKISLQEGISNLVEWYNTERAWASQIDTN